MNSPRPHNFFSGFTLIEVLVVVAIIGSLAAIGVANFSDTSASSRDAQRQNDLRNLQNAIETYKNQEGRYPIGCNGPNTWAGQLDTNYECNSGLPYESTFAGTGQYIVNLAPAYIPVLPTDPKLNGTNSGYVYQTNTDGTVYKLKAYNTVENEVVTRNHPFKPCDIRGEQNVAGSPLSGSRDPRVIGWCAAISDGVANFTYPQTDCNEHTDLFRTSYAVWGGIAPLYDGDLGAGNPFGIDVYAADPLEVIAPPENRKDRKRFGVIKDTANIICK